MSAADRRAERRARVLEAALVVVGDAGTGAATAELISQRAGLSKRYFYESFPDRDAVLLAAFEQLLRAVTERIAAQLTDVGPTLLERTTATVDAVVSALEADPRAARLYVEARGNAALAPGFDRGIEFYVDLVITDVLQVRRSPRARIAATMIVSGTTDIVVRWLSGRLRMSRRQLVQHLAELGEVLGRDLAR